MTASTTARHVVATSRPEPAPPRPGPVSRVLVAVIRGYRMVISPALAPSCRYVPSCSAYAVEAIEVHGAGRGTWLAARRLLRCHPFHAGGHDPVPPRVGCDESSLAPSARDDRVAAKE